VVSAEGINSQAHGFRCWLLIPSGRKAVTPKENTPKWSVLKVSTAKRPQISVLAVDTFNNKNDT